MTEPPASGGPYSPGPGEYSPGPSGQYGQGPYGPPPGGDAPSSGGFGQPDPYAQPAQPDPYGQPAQPDPYAQPGQYGPPPGQYGAQPGQYGVGPAPAAGYSVPPPPPQPGYDPLISADYNGWWQRGMNIVKNGWKVLALLQAIAAGVVLLLQTPVAVYLAIVSKDLQDQAANPDSAAAPDFSGLFAVLGFTLVVALVGMLVAAMVTIASIQVGVSIAMGIPPNVGAALSTAARRVFPLIGWQLLASLLVLVGFCACILPGIYVIAVIAVLPAVVAFERTNAIGRCFKLFHADFGLSAARIATILGLNLGAGVIGGIIGSALSAGVSAAASGQGGIIAGTLISTLIGAVVSGAVAVLIQPLILAAYADMRARVEQVNTATLAQELGLTQPAMG